MKYIIIYLLLLGIGIGGLQIFELITNKNYYGWPAVTKCRICNKTVLIWQNYERRNYTVKGDSNAIISIFASGLVHTNCKGNPDFKINIEVK